MPTDDPDRAADSDAEAEMARLRTALARLEEHHRHTIELNPQVFWTANAQGEVDDASVSWFELVGLPREAALGYGWTQAVDPDDVKIAFAQWAVCLPTGQNLDVEYRWRLKDGQYYWFRARARPVRDDQGQITRWYGSTENIHERKMATLALQESENRLRLALQAGRLGVWEIDIPTDRVVVSDRFAQMCGLARGDEIADYAALRAVMHPDDRAAQDAVRAQFLHSAHKMETVFRALWPDGSTHWIQVSGQVTRCAAGEAVRAIGTAVDITAHHLAEAERERAAARMVHLATHDPLTDLANSRLLQSSLSAALARRRPDALVALLAMDLHDFKVINDALGHASGDQLLQLVAERLRACCGGEDLVARSGGGEFVVLCRHAASRAEIAAYARRIADAMARPAYIGKRMIALSVSIGIACAPEDAADGDGLRKNASTALSRGKSIGRGRIQFFEPEMDRRLQAREALRLELQGAIERDELVLLYQPIIDLRRGRIVSFEALMRWQHGERGMISPADFIPLAEETGWIVAFGRWALRAACCAAASWPEAVGVAVNLSLVQFSAGCLEEDVAAALQESGLAPGRLELEVTESLLLRDTAENAAILRGLRSMGVRLSMDDFGTGYASLSSLRVFRFDKVKLDKSLIDGVPDGGEGDAIVRGVLGLTGGLQLDLTAEGVESPAQRDFLRAAGCAQAQGYLFSRPVPGAQVAGLLAQARTQPWAER